MNHYAKKRCADPSAFYSSAEDILKDKNLSTTEKEHVLKSLAVDVELLKPTDEEKTVKGEHPPDADQITSALGQLRSKTNQQPREDSNFDQPESGSGFFSRVLVALSGDNELDVKVVKYATAITQMSGAMTTFVSVVQPVTVTGGFGASIPITAAATDPAATETEVSQREDVLRERLSSVLGTSGQYQLEVRNGFVDEEIHKSAVERDVDLIIVGAHDRNWIEGLLSVKTSRQIAEHSDRPVLIVPE